MKITICGSMQFEPKMTELMGELLSRGYEVDKPSLVESSIHDSDKDLDRRAHLRSGLIDEHFAKIDMSEAILVVNETKEGVDGYIGGNTLIEIAHAYSQGLDVFLLNPIPEMSYTDEIRGMHPVILNGDFDKLDTYVASLPLVYMSTESTLKHGAVARALRRVGVPVRVVGKKVDSGVKEQPMTIEETYEGAINRHKALLTLNQQADYYVTVESGQHPVHANHSLFGCNVIIVEPAGKTAKIGIDLDIEFPQAWLDTIPSKYPDLGILVQQEYGAAEKDPYPYLTNGKLTRRKILENAVYNLMIQI